MILGFFHFAPPNPTRICYHRPPALSHCSPPWPPAENIDSKFKGTFYTIFMLIKKPFYIKKVKERFFLFKGEAVLDRKAVSKCMLYCEADVLLLAQSSFRWFKK